MSVLVKPIIVSDPQRKFGQPTFAGTRLTLTFIIELLRTWTVSEVLKEYPYLDEHRGLLTEIRDIVKEAPRGR